jgi:hypothetical protein
VPAFFTKILTYGETMIVIFLLLLDFQATRTADIPNSDFRVTEIEEPALTGCAMTPNNGTLNDVILIQAPYHLPDDEPFRFDTPQQGDLSNNTTDRDKSLQRTVQRMLFPPVAPPEPPEPPQPPVTTPEPPPIAILTITGLALLFLLFGRRIRCRFR